MSSVQTIVVPPITSYTNIVDNLYTSLVGIIGTKTISSTDIVPLAINLMQLVEKYPSLTGDQKKNLVISTFKLFISDTLTSINPVLAQTLTIFIDTFLPSIIDIIISVDSGKVVIAVENDCKKWCCC